MDSSNTTCPVMPVLDAANAAFAFKAHREQAYVDDFCAGLLRAEELDGELNLLPIGCDTDRLHLAGARLHGRGSEQAA